MLKTIFFGTPPVAVPFLENLRRISKVVGVVTSPDKPAGRGYALSMPAVKKAALAAGIPVLQPASLRKEPVLEQLQKWGPADLGVVVAYGKIIPPEIFNHPRLGMMNAHFSLLPNYRGAAPVQWALIRGETVTGVTLFRLEEGLDCGPIYLRREEPVHADDNSWTLRERLASIGQDLLAEAVSGFERGDLSARPQEGPVTLAPILKKEDGRVDWTALDSLHVANLARGLYEWPGAFCRYKGQTLKLKMLEAHLWQEGRPGEVVHIEKGLGFYVKCKSDAVLVLSVQPEGKREMDGWSFCNGARLKVGDMLE